MPVPAIAQAIRAPNGPVARPNVDGNENIPAPTIEPMTRANNEARDNFWVNSCATMLTRPPP